MMERVRSQLIWLIFLASTLSACGPLKGIGKGLGELLKGITLPGP